MWELKEPDPLYGNYSTKDWRKSYVYEDEGKYHSERLCFRSKEDLEKYIRIVKGEIFEGQNHNQQVLFSYYETFCCISQQEWDDHDLPAINIEWNGIRPAKYHIDDTTRTTTFYYFYTSF